MVVAISPSPALDGVLAGLRGLLLLRQVAAIHGMRPGGAVMLVLLRRLAWTAAGISAMDLLGQDLADSALSHVPVLRQLAAALPGSSLTALRLRRLADAAAQACSPLEVSQQGNRVLPLKHPKACSWRSGERVPVSQSTSDELVIAIVHHKFTL